MTRLSSGNVYNRPIPRLAKTVFHTCVCEIHIQEIKALQQQTSTGVGSNISPFYRPCIEIAAYDNAVLFTAACHSFVEKRLELGVCSAGFGVAAVKIDAVDPVLVSLTSR